jgi:hypothetical protein
MICYPRARLAARAISGLLLLSMGGEDREENLRFAMHIIKKSHCSERSLMLVITIRNE